MTGIIFIKSGQILAHCPGNLIVLLTGCSSGAKPHKQETADPGPKFATARLPVSKPSADPELELSPLRAPGNQKPQKSPVKVMVRTGLGSFLGSELWGWCLFGISFHSFFGV